MGILQRFEVNKTRFITGGIENSYDYTGFDLCPDELYGYIADDISHSSGGSPFSSDPGRLGSGTVTHNGYVVKGIFSYADLDFDENSQTCINLGYNLYVAIRGYTGTSTGLFTSITYKNYLGITTTFNSSSSSYTAATSSSTEAWWSWADDIDCRVGTGLITFS